MAFTDDFNRADEDLEASADWTLVEGSSGDLAIVSNQLDTTTTLSSAGAVYHCPDQGIGDKYVQGDILVQGNPFPLAMRATATSDYIGGRVSTDVVQLYKRVANSFTLLGSYSETFTSGYTLKIEMTGDSFEVFYNGVSRITSVESFNSSETGTGTAPRAVGALPLLDNFEAGLLSTTPAPPSGLSLLGVGA